MTLSFFHILYFECAADEANLRVSREELQQNESKNKPVCENFVTGLSRELLYPSNGLLLEWIEVQTKKKKYISTATTASLKGNTRGSIS